MKYVLLILSWCPFIHAMEQAIVPIESKTPIKEIALYVILKNIKDGINVGAQQTYYRPDNTGTFVRCENSYFDSNAESTPVGTYPFKEFYKKITPAYVNKPATMVYQHFSKTSTFTAGYEIELSDVGEKTARISYFKELQILYANNDKNHLDWNEFDKHSIPFDGAPFVDTRAGKDDLPLILEISVSMRS